MMINIIKEKKEKIVGLFFWTFLVQMNILREIQGVYLLKEWGPTNEPLPAKAMTVLHE